MGVHVNTQTCINYQRCTIERSAYIMLTRRPTIVLKYDKVLRCRYHLCIAIIKLQFLVRFKLVLSLSLVHFPQLIGMLLVSRIRIVKENVVEMLRYHGIHVVYIYEIGRVSCRERV